MNREAKTILIEILQDYYDGGDSSIFNFYVPWTPEREEFLRSIKSDTECDFELVIKREQPHMNPESIIIQGIDIVVRYFIKVLKQEIKDEINQKNGTGIVRVNLPVGDPDRLGTDRL